MPEMPTTTAKFDELYKKLNKEQRQAVDTVEGPLIVIAGPGTGKTSVLTLRIANILRLTDTAPENILALTFTESGVHSIRKKLVDTIGVAGFRVKIYTFHSFCNDVIKNFPQEFPRIIGAQHVTDIDQVSIMEEIIGKTKLESLKPYGDPLYYLKPALSFIKELKREDVGPDEYRKIVKTYEKDLEGLEDFRHEKGAYKGEIKAKYKPAIRKIENGLEFATLYEKYQEALNEKRLYDYEDMIVEVLRELRENKDLLLELQETHQYILADEHQDANRGQNRLLELLSGFHENPNLFVVGDEKQAIFRFQGASLENFLYFKRRFPGAAVISLNKNYRSTQGILDASHSLITNNSSGSGDIERVRLLSKDSASADAVANIFLTECISPQAEIANIANIIQQKILAGEKPEQIAVLFRDNRDAELIARTLDHKGVPYVLHADSNVIADEQIQKLVHILRAVNDFGNDFLLAPVLFLDLFKLDNLDVFKVIKRSRDARRSIAEVIKFTAELEEARVEEPQKFVALYHTLHELSVLARNKSLVEAVQAIVTKIGFVGFLLAQSRSLELVEAYEALLAHMIELMERHRDAKLNDYLAMLEKMTVHGVTVKAPGVSAYPGKINLMTAHKSKGLEFDFVFAVHLNDGKWGGRRSLSHFLPITATATDDNDDDVSDERRLLYVVLTRARKEIFLTYATHNASGRALLPSRFINEIDAGLVNLAKCEDGPTAQLAATPNGDKHEIAVKDKDYIRHIFLEQGFSVSALNNYLTCPWRYFFINLIRIPNAQERHQLYGTAIHETLHAFFDAYKIDHIMSKKELLDLFEKFLNRKALSTSDYELFLEKGTESLGGYYETYKGTWNKNIFNEFTISGVHVRVDQLPDSPNGGQDSVDIVLRGQLDKVELDEGSNVNVVDYKTGNPKSRRDIEGETKTSEGNYKRQLVFYKILLDGFDNGRFVMKTGEIDFVEPNKQGNYKKEKFEVTDAEVKELIELIKKAAREILSSSFWNTTCEDSKCEFCEMKRLLIEG